MTGHPQRLSQRIAFLSGDFTHPAKDTAGWHPATPGHLRPSANGRLDLDACGRYLTDNGFDTGILDVIQVDRVRRTLDETSGGRFGEWLSTYANLKKRTPARFRRGDVAHVGRFATRLRDSTHGW
jgi:hypothetical protein